MIPSAGTQHAHKATGLYAERPAREGLKGKVRFSIMKRTFWNNVAASCAAMEMNMGLDIGHLLNDSEREEAPRA